MLHDESVRQLIDQAGEPTGEILFSPLLIKRADIDLDLENNRLSENELLAYCSSCTEIMDRLTHASDEALAKRLQELPEHAQAITAEVPKSKRGSAMS